MYSTGSFFRNTFPAVLFIVVGFQSVSVVPVDAEWRLVDGHNRAKVYVDIETISRQGELVSVWVMDDLQVARARGLRTYWSTRALEEHDCARERFRLQVLEYFSGNMGSGEAFYKTAGESDWPPVPRGTLAQSVWKFVCAWNIR